MTGLGNRAMDGDVAALPPPPPRPADGNGDLGGRPCAAAAAAWALLSAPAPAPGASSPLEAVLAVLWGLLGNLICVGGVGRSLDFTIGWCVGDRVGSSSWILLVRGGGWW